MENIEKFKEELLDRVYVQACNVQDHLLDHPYTDYNDHIAVRLQLVFDTLMDIIEQPDSEEEDEEDLALDMDDNTTTTSPPLFQDPTFSSLI